MKNGLTTSLLFFSFFLMPKIWAGWKTLKGEKKKDGLSCQNEIIMTVAHGVVSTVGMLYRTFGAQIKIARLNRKSFFYLNHHPLVHFLSDRSQQKVNLHYSLFQLLRLQMPIKKDNTNTILEESHPVYDISGHVPVIIRLICIQ